MVSIGRTSRLRESIPGWGVGCRQELETGFEKSLIASMQRLLEPTPQQAATLPKREGEREEIC